MNNIKHIKVEMTQLTILSWNLNGFWYLHLSTESSQLLVKTPPLSENMVEQVGMLSSEEMNRYPQQNGMPSWSTKCKHLTAIDN